MVSNASSNEIWSLLSRTLPERNQDSLRVKKDALQKKYGPVEMPRKGTIWKLDCGSCFIWPRDNPHHWMCSKRICCKCGHDKFKHDEEVGLFLLCERCREAQLLDDDAGRATEERELIDRWSVAIDCPTEQIPSLTITTSFSRWSEEEIAEVVVDKLQPSEDAERILQETLRLAERDPNFWSIMDRQKAATAIINNLRFSKSDKYIALRSPSEVLISRPGYDDLSIERLGDNSYAYELRYTDGVAWAPLLVLDKPSNT